MTFHDCFAPYIETKERVGLLKSSQWRAARPQRPINNFTVSNPGLQKKFVEELRGLLSSPKVETRKVEENPAWVNFDESEKARRRKLIALMNGWLEEDPTSDREMYSKVQAGLKAHPISFRVPKV